MTRQATGKADDPATPLWFDDLRPGSGGEGFLEKQLRHSLMFVRRPVNRLLVTFDNLSNVGDSDPMREPWAFKFARDINVCHLGIMAHVADWYRDPALIARMQQLAHDGFFEGYDRVLFAGVSMGGFASLSFGSLVPGAHAVAINPQSTLDTDLVPWETRYENGRRQDWTLPLSDAADLTAGFERVNLFYDPYHALDHRHVGRFSGDNIRIFNCRYSSHKTAVFLRKIGALKPVMSHALFDELTADTFYRLYRGRRDLPWFRGAVAGYFRDRGRDEIADGFTRTFRQRLRAQAEARADDTPDPATEDLEAFGPNAVDWGDSAPENDTSDEEDDAATVPAPDRLSRPMGARDNDRCTIITTMKNEGPFMLEWVAYNRSIGFTDFLIFTNHCADGTDRIAMRLEEMGLARHIDNVFKEGASPQRVALRRANHEDLLQHTDWAICADCDEFLNIRAGEGHLSDLFQAVGEADAISLCWKLFGCGTQATYEDRFVTEQFTWGAPEDYRDKYRALGLKTLFRPSDAVTRYGVHRPKFDGRPEGFVWKDASGQPMPEAFFESGWSAGRRFRNDHARLHHYAVRSPESFLVKRDRGRTNHIKRDQGLAYWSDMNLNMEEDRSILPRLARARAEFDQLLQDPELARLHEEAVAWHRGRIEALKRDEEWASFYEALLQINRPGEMPQDGDHLLAELASE